MALQSAEFVGLVDSVGVLERLWGIDLGLTRGFNENRGILVPSDCGHS